MEKKNKFPWNTVIRWVGTILSVIILVVILRQVGWQEALAQVAGLGSWRVALILVLVFTSRLATWGRWHSLLQVGEHKVGWKDSLKLTFAGLFTSNVLPTTIGGDVFRLAGAARLGMDGSLAAASLVADRLVGMAGMLIVLPLALPSFIKYVQSQTALPGAAFLFSLALIPDLFSRLQRGLKKILANFVYWKKHPLILLKALGFTFIHMAAVFLIIKLLVEGMGETMPFYKIAGLWSLTYFITLLPISINGLGLQELTITNLFVALGGLLPSTSISLAVILRVVWLIGSLPGALTLSSVMGGKRSDPVSSEE